MQPVAYNNPYSLLAEGIRSFFVYFCLPPLLFHCYPRPPNFEKKSPHKGYGIFLTPLLTQRIHLFDATLLEDNSDCLFIIHPILGKEKLQPAKLYKLCTNFKTIHFIFLSCFSFLADDHERGEHKSIQSDSCLFVVHNYYKTTSQPSICTLLMTAMQVWGSAQTAPRV